MDDAGAVFGGGIVRQVHGGQAVVSRVHVCQRVVERDAIQHPARRHGQYLACQPVALQARLDQGLGQDQQAARRVHQRIRQLGVDVERLVGRNGPGGGGPDDGVDGPALQPRRAAMRQAGVAEKGLQHALGLGAQKAHVQRLALFVGVFDFELSQRRAAVEAPVHGFQTPIDEAALHHALEGADFLGLVFEVHRAVGALPIAQHAQALEVGHLLRDLLGGKSPRLGLHLIAAQAPAVQLLDGVFNRQAVTVPARDVLRVEAGELARLDDHVLENLVDGVPDVNAAVGVGWSVVQDELGRAGARLAQTPIDALFLPLAHPIRLALRQVAAHRKRRVGQVERVAVIGQSVGGAAFGHDGRAGVGPCAANQARASAQSWAMPAVSASRLS